MLETLTSLTEPIAEYLGALSIMGVLSSVFRFIVGTVVMLESFIVIGVIMTTYSNNLIKSGRHFLIFLLILVILSL